jgi:hypothetical protein
MQGSLVEDCMLRHDGWHCRDNRIELVPQLPGCGRVAKTARERLLQTGLAVAIIVIAAMLGITVRSLTAVIRPVTPEPE